MNKKLIRKMLTAAGGPIELYNTLWVDNWRNRLTSPIVVAKQLEELTSKIPIKYLGGNKDNAREEFYSQEPVLRHAIDSIANRYNISPESLRYRLNREGFTDRLIKRRNSSVKLGTQKITARGYELLNNPLYGLDGTQMGLDDAKTYINSGLVKLINENWYDRAPFKNEKGRTTYPVTPVTLNDGMGIVAAHLKYFKDKALEDFPNVSEYDLNRYSNAYYNKGAYGGKKWVLAGAKGYNYRKKGGMLEFLKNGSGIHIKEKNKGKFTSYCGGKVTNECILKGKNSSNPAIRKRATFAANARKWKHELGGPIKYKKHQAFVPGASITDSNPKAYWLLKKKKGKTEWIDKSSKGLKIKFLLGGLLKFQEGGKNGAPAKKNSWWKRTVNNIGDFMSSDAGQFIANNLLLGGMSYLNTSNTLDASNASNQANLERTYLDIMLEAMLNRIIRQLQLKNQWQLAYLNGETLDNYSDVVASHIGWKEYSLSLLNAEQLKKQQEALMDLQAKLAKSSALGNLFGSVILSGLGVLGNTLGNKNSTASTTQNLLNSSTIGKSTNPYMYTGLGANYNASTFFNK